MVCLHPINIEGRALPCGRCPACRIQKTNEWVTRILHEMNYHNESIFLTLTYNPESLPENSELVPDDLKNFWKRLRKKLDKKIKYYACGEYGTDYRRPHYHAIVFGLSMEDYKKIDEAWDLGFIKVGTVTEQSIRYVASYIMDKDESINMSEFTGVTVAPFSRSSIGIGKRYVMEHREKLLNDMFIKRRDIKLGLPKYYKRLLADDIDTEKVNEMALERSRDNDIKLMTLGVPYIERAEYSRLYRNQRAEELKFLAARRKERKKL